LQANEDMIKRNITTAVFNKTRRNILIKSFLMLS
jgi:hypothetical protein